MMSHGSFAVRCLVAAPLISACIVVAGPGAELTGEPAEPTETGTTTGAITIATTEDLEPTSTTGVPVPPPPPCRPVCAETWEFAGELHLDADDDLTQFACLGSVTGIFSISGPHAVEALAVFADLTTVGRLDVRSNPMLTDLSPFACLRDAGGLNLQALPALENASLGRLRSAERLSLNGTALTALPSFAPEFAGVRSLRLWHNGSLVDLDSAAHWPALGALDLDLLDDPALTSIASLAPLLAGDERRISLRQLPALESLAGLEGTTSGSLDLLFLPQVTSLAPLAGLVKVGSLNLRELTGITSLTGLEQLEQAEFLAIGGCNSDDDGVGIPLLADLSGLDHLHTAEFFTIADNGGLVDLGGMPMLASVTQFSLIDNPMLNDDDFAALQAQVPQASGCIGDWKACTCASGPHS